MQCGLAYIETAAPHPASASTRILYGESLVVLWGWMHVLVGANRVFQVLGFAGPVGDGEIRVFAFHEGA